MVFEDIANTFLEKDLVASLQQDLSFEGILPLIEFSIGPGNKEEHDLVLSWLTWSMYDFKVSYNGDHYSEIHVLGDYKKAYECLCHLPFISFEHWEH